MRRRLVTLTAAVLLGVLALTSTVPAQDINTLLFLFLQDFQAGTLGVKRLLTKQTVTQNGIATTSTDGYFLLNGTSATSGVTSQLSPRVRWRGTGYNSTSTLSETQDFAAYVVPNTTAGTTTSSLTFFRSLNGAAYQNIFSMATSGTIILNVSGVNSTLSWFNRSRLASTANGLFNIIDPSSVIGVQFNYGTAEATFNNGTITTGSRNVTGQVTLTGANTGGTLTFGLPNWTNTPFCVVTGSAATDIPRITAASVSAFTIAGITANGVFTYHCIGRI